MTVFSTFLMMKTISMIPLSTAWDKASMEIKVIQVSQETEHLQENSLNPEHKLEIKNQILEKGDLLCDCLQLVR